MDCQISLPCPQSPAISTTEILSLNTLGVYQGIENHRALLLNLTHFLQAVFKKCLAMINFIARNFELKPNESCIKAYIVGLVYVLEKLKEHGNQARIQYCSLRRAILNGK